MEYVILDLEATCWEGNPAGRIQEIIEIGAVRLDRYGRELSQFEAFVRPIHYPSLSIYCKNLTGITQDNVDKAPPFASVGSTFIDWVEDADSHTRICSWGDKDRDLLLSHCREFRLDTDWMDDYVDLKAEYHHIRNIQKKIGLKKALLREDLEFDGAHHRAFDDASNLARLFVKYIDEWPH